MCDGYTSPQHPKSNICLSLYYRNQHLCRPTAIALPLSYTLSLNSALNLSMRGSLLLPSNASRTDCVSGGPLLLQHWRRPVVIPAGHTTSSTTCLKGQSTIVSSAVVGPKLATVDAGVDRLCGHIKTLDEGIYHSWLFDCYTALLPIALHSAPQIPT